MSLNTLFYLVFGLVVWGVLVGPMAPVDAVLGLLVVGSGWLVSRRLTDFTTPLPLSQALPRLRRLMRYFLGYVAGEVVASTWRVFSKVLQPRIVLAPAITAVTVPGSSRSSLILLAYGISLTPGQQIVAIDEDRRVLYVHTYDAPDPDAVRARIVAVYRRYLEEAS